MPKVSEQERLKAYEKRRRELKKLSDDQLKKRFWDLCNQVVRPMVDLSKTHTSPSIERSVLMRMGIDTFTASGVVAKVVEAGLLGKGAGGVVLRVAQKLSCTPELAAKRIAEDASVLEGLYK